MIDIHTELHTMFGISTVVHIDNKSRKQWDIWHNTTYNTPFQTPKENVDSSVHMSFTLYPY